MHSPKAVLHAGRFRVERGLAGMSMYRERKVVKNHAQPFAVFFFRFLQHARHGPAGRTLEIAELFDRHCRLSLAAHMNAGRGAALGAVRRRESLGPIEREPAAECGEGHKPNNKKWQIPLHREPKENHWSANASKLSWTAIMRVRDPRESAVVLTNFEPGPYTAIVRSKNNSLVLAW